MNLWLKLAAWALIAIGFAIAVVIHYGTPLDDLDPDCPDEVDPDESWPTWEEDEPFGYEAAS